LSRSPRLADNLPPTGVVVSFPCHQRPAGPIRERATTASPFFVNKYYYYWPATRRRTFIEVSDFVASAFFYLFFCFFVFLISFTKIKRAVCNANIYNTVVSTTIFYFKIWCFLFMNCVYDVIFYRFTHTHTHTCTCRYSKYPKRGFPIIVYDTFVLLTLIIVEN